MPSWISCQRIEISLCTGALNAETENLTIREQTVSAEAAFQEQERESESKRQASTGASTGDLYWDS